MCQSMFLPTRKGTNAMTVRSVNFLLYDYILYIIRSHPRYEINVERLPGCPGGCGTGIQLRTGTQPWAMVPPTSLPLAVQWNSVRRGTKDLSLLIFPNCMLNDCLVFFTWLVCKQASQWLSLCREFCASCPTTTANRPEGKGGLPCLLPPAIGPVLSRRMSDLKSSNTGQRE